MSNVPDFQQPDLPGQDIRNPLGPSGQFFDPFVDQNPSLSSWGFNMQFPDGSMVGCWGGGHQYGIGTMSHNLPNTGYILSSNGLAQGHQAYSRNPLTRSFMSDSSFSDPGSVFSSFSSTGTSDMMGAMSLEDDVLQWPASSPEEDMFCNGKSALDRMEETYQQRQEHDDPAGSGSRAVTSLQAVREPTVSPSLLRLRPSPTPPPASSTESLLTSYLQTSRDEEMLAFLSENSITRESPKSAEPMASPGTPRGTRKRLPDSAPGSGIISSLIRLGGNRGSAGRESKSTRASLSRRTPSSKSPPPIIHKNLSKLRPKHAIKYTIVEELPPSPPVPPAPTPKKERTLRRLRPSPLPARPTAPVPLPPPPPSPSPPPVTGQLCSPKPDDHRQSDRESDFDSDSDTGPIDKKKNTTSKFKSTREANNFLISKRNQGMAYKDIKKLGGFTEAESTLRGRYRTLTKSRDQRVRKPDWTEHDVSLTSLLLLPHP